MRLPNENVRDEKLMTRQMPSLLSKVCWPLAGICADKKREAHTNAHRSEPIYRHEVSRLGDEMSTKIIRKTEGAELRK